MRRYDADETLSEETKRFIDRCALPAKKRPPAPSVCAGGNARLPYRRPRLHRHCGCCARPAGSPRRTAARHRLGGSPVVTMPMHWPLSAAAYLDQFCFSVSRAVVSSARQASLLRPRMTAPRAAASQLGPTLSVGGPPAPARAFCPRDGPPARACAFCPCDGCCSRRELSAGRSSRATSGGKS